MVRIYKWPVGYREEIGTGERRQERGFRTTERERNFTSFLYPLSSILYPVSSLLSAM
jgi:hypothetical protein